MKLSDTINFLHANVDAWSYVSDCRCPSAVAGQAEPFLRLSGTTRLPFADLAHPLPITLSLLHDEDGDDCEIYHPWQLNLIDTLHEYDIPTNLEGLFTLPKAVLADLRECLFRAARSRGYTVQFRLETREQLERESTEWKGRCFSLLAFGYDLNYQKESP